MIGWSIGSERVSHRNRSVGAAKESLLQDGCQDQHGGASNQIVPQVTNVRRSKQDEHERLCDQRREENRRSSDSTNKEGGQKQTKYAAVEQWAKNVSCFDQVLDQACKWSDSDGDKAPGRC